MKLHSRERDFRNDIVRVHCQRTVEHCFVFSVTPEDSVTDRNLLKRFSITRVKVNCALEVLHRLLPTSLSPLDVTHELEYPRIIRKSLASNFQFSQRATMIEVSMIKISRVRQVCFA